VIRTHALTRRFNGRVAVDAVSLDVQPGEIFALLGPNGAGKTTTLRLIGGLILPTSGSAEVAGIPLVRSRMHELRSLVGFLTEAPGLWDRLTVTRNLLVYARLYAIAEPARAVARALDMLGLADRAHTPAGQLSKGMKQRVALARSLMHDPPVILLDEPTSGLDPQTARLVRELILERRSRGRTIVISTHNLDEAERLSDRVGVLQSRLVAVDSPDGLRRRLFGQRVRVRVAHEPQRFARIAASDGAQDVEMLADGFSVSLADPARQVPDLVRALVHAGADVQGVAPDHASLEDVYLRLIEENGASEAS
jgi:ABC-2 type transport system ATP-binding protein